MYVADVLTIITYYFQMAEASIAAPTPEHNLLTRQNGGGDGETFLSEQQQLQQATHSPYSSRVLSQLELDMFAKVVRSGLTIKSQQRGEPDLTQEQKLEALRCLLYGKPGAFLMRFGKVLDDKDLVWFDHLSSTDFEVDFRVKELRKNLAMSSKSRENVVKNRRFEYLKELMDSSSYFSEEEMRNRNPLLYEHYIGQYLSEEERQLLDNDVSSDMTLSGMILKKMELDRRSELLSRQQEVEAGQIVESDSSDSSESEDTEDERETEENLGMKLSTDPVTAGREKEMLKEEFLKAMQLKFLSGEEKDFDYSKVDSNEKYDSIDARQRDEEDDYFDTEEPSRCEEFHSNDGMGMEVETTGLDSEPDDYMTYEPPS